MPINIYSVRNHLESEGWKLISDTYKNLHTELEMICPNGHKQIRTYEDWRKHPTCDKCFGGNKKIKKNIVPIKKIDTQRILALDAATNTTGYAIFDDGELVSFGVFKTDSDKDTEERIHQVKIWLHTAIQTWEPDFIGIEQIQLQTYNGHQAQVQTFQVLANLQGVLLDTLFEDCIDHDLVYSNEWRKYCNINTEHGRENKKKIAQEKVKQWYGQDCTQDEADAICIGKYFVGKLKNSYIKWGEDI